MERYIRIARNEAQLASASGYRPNGCVAVHSNSGDIVEVARDKTSEKNPLVHAAMELISQMSARITKAKLDSSQHSSGHIGKDAYLMTGKLLFLAQDFKLC